MTVKGPSCHLPTRATWFFLGLLGGPMLSSDTHSVRWHQLESRDTWGTCAGLKGQEEGVEGQPGLCSPAGPSPQRDWPQG